MGRTRYLSALLGQAAVWHPPSPGPAGMGPPPSLPALHASQGDNTILGAWGDAPCWMWAQSSLWVSCCGEKTGRTVLLGPDARIGGLNAGPGVALGMGLFSSKPLSWALRGPSFVVTLLSAPVSLPQRRHAPQQPRHFCCPALPPPLPNQGHGSDWPISPLRLPRSRSEPIRLLCLPRSFSDSPTGM